ncbi:MAG: DNA polymerase III subunit alpha [Armatimonadetes bacterium]|nr:DNA polymerase III subunit alpha [Armatimonadota bacterium]
MGFAHLHVHSYFSLLEGAAPLEQLTKAAAGLGMRALALTDHDGLYGAVRFYKAARNAGLKPIIGVEITVEPVAKALSRDTHLILLAQDNQGYSNLCQLVTAARLRDCRRCGPFAAEFQRLDRASPLLTQEQLQRHASHLIALSGCEQGEIAQWLQAGNMVKAEKVAQYYRGLFGPGNFYLELQNLLLPPPRQHLRYELAHLAYRLGLPIVATNDVHYVTPEYARVQDVLLCIRHNRSVDEEVPERKVNSEYWLKPPEEMGRLFADLPEALRATEEIAERCNWELDLDHLHLPRFSLEAVEPERCGPYPSPEPGEDSRWYLRRLCYTGARWRYGEISAEVGKRLEYELQVIESRDLSDYFLIVWDIVRFARSRGIRATGRGSAGDALVSYVLDITQADPLAHDLLFERFLNPERQGMPDIDVDFCSRRRDEVTAYVYDRYGVDQVAAVCTLNTFRARAAIREVGKALGMEEAEIASLARTLPHISAARLEEAAQELPELRDGPVDLRGKGLLLELCRQISGFPRHLSVHVGGLVIGAQPLTQLMPLEVARKGIVIGAFDKDDIEALGLMKMDILGLRIHTAIADCLEHIATRTGRELDLERIPLDDAATFKLLRSTQTVGLFQLESPGQRNLLGRAQPCEFEEIIANISLFRPGPVQADMIQPYLRRKHHLEPITYLHPALEPILRRTYGVIIYQEQVLQVAAAIAGFSLGQGDMLRRAMTSDRSPREMEALRAQFVEGAIGRGVDRYVADRIFNAIAGFAAYGFNKAHAACFGRIAYQTAYLKAHYPAEFLAGILSAQPMGFYPPRTIAEEAKRLGVRILPPCVNRSERRFTVESMAPESSQEMAEHMSQARPGESNSLGIRYGLSFLHGMSEAAVTSILRARADGPFRSLRDFCRRTSVPRPMVESLILAQAFAFTGKTPAELMWTLAAMPTAEVADRRGYHGVQTLDFAEGECLDRLLPPLDPETEHGRVSLDLHLLGLSTGRHPFAFWRRELRQRGVVTSADIYRYQDGERVRVAGIVVARARPPTRSGKTAIFISLEDETGLVDVACFEEVYQRYGKDIVSSPVLLVEGKLVRQGALDISVTAESVLPLGQWGEATTQGPADALPTAARAFASKDWGR